jgi:hypothetical protein
MKDTEGVRNCGRGGCCALLGPSRAASCSAFVLVEVEGGTYHGVRDNVTIYKVWPYPGELAWGASYHNSGRFVVKAKTLNEMHRLLEARCNAPTTKVSDPAGRTETKP